MYTTIFIKRLLLILTLFFSTIAYGQISIFGRVTDNTNNPVPFSQIILKKTKDSSIIKTEITDSIGRFQINTNQSKFFVEVNAPGYERKYIEVPDPDKELINLPITINTKSHELNEVSVIASKPLLERKPDRIIFNVGSSIAAIGSDVYEMLKKAPNVRVSETNGIGIAGKSTVSVMIDNKLQQLGSMELAAMLRSMPADNIEKIEVITTPPAKYDAQGNSGIINIVTKRQKRNGLNGNIGLGYQVRTNSSEKFSENLNYRNGKINIYSTGNTNNFNFYSQQKTIVPYNSQRQEQSLDQHNNPFYNRYQLGMDYNINSNSVIGVLYTLGATDRETRQEYRAPIISVADGATDSLLQTFANEKEKAIRHVANLNYEWRIDTSGKKLNIDADYFYRTEEDTRDFNSQSFFASGTAISPPAYNLTTANQEINISSIKADIILPADKIEWTLGVKTSAIHNISDNSFSYLKNGNYTPDPTKSFQFDYTEKTQAAYISASAEWEKWETQLGLRVENTQTKGISRTNAQTVTNNYLQLFPTAYLQYLPNDNNAFNINYSRRIGRPSIEELNPFRQYGTGTSYETGNPFLQPSFYHTVEASYSYKSKYTFTAYTGIVNNIHSRISNVDTINSTFYITNANAGTSINTGISIVLIFNPFNWWESTVQTNGFYDKVNSTYYNSLAATNGTMAFDFQTNNSFIFNKSKTLSGEANFTYNSRFQYDFVIQKPLYTINVGAKALLLEKQLTVAVNVFDIFRSEYYSFKNIYNNVVEEAYYDARCLSISLLWKFGKKTIKAKRQRETETEEIRRSQ